MEIKEDPEIFKGVGIGLMRFYREVRDWMAADCPLGEEHRNREDIVAATKIVMRGAPMGLADYKYVMEVLGPIWKECQDRSGLTCYRVMGVWVDDNGVVRRRRGMPGPEDALVSDVLFQRAVKLWRARVGSSWSGPVLIFDVRGGGGLQKVETTEEGRMRE